MCQNTTTYNTYFTSYVHVYTRNKCITQNATYISHVQISPCTDMGKLCQYIYASYELTTINNVTRNIDINFTLLAYAPDQICLPHCIYMSYHTTNVAYMSSQYHCICKFKRNFDLDLLCYYHICATTNMFLKCHIWKLVHVQMAGNHVSIYTSCEVTVIISVTRSTSTHTFHIIGRCSWKNVPAIFHICPTACLHRPNITANIS